MKSRDWRAAARPEAVVTVLNDRADELLTAAQSHGHGGGSLRSLTHRGHRIEIRTTYEITVDGRPFPVSMSVDHAGSVHYHGLPTRDFASAVDLVKEAIDTFPGDFTGGDDPGHENHEHGDHEHGGSGHGGHA
jgi:hypothetical protein